MEAAKERFAGANELALPVDAFQRDYPDLAEAVREYASFYKTKLARAQHMLSLKLFIGSVENSDQFRALARFLMKPVGGSLREEMKHVLQKALKANYDRLAGSGFYSAGTALEHGRRAIAIFRWLGQNKRFYPELPKKIALRPHVRKGARKAKDVEAPFAPMDVARIRSILGDVFYQDLMTYLEGSSRGTRRVLGFRYMMSCITLNPSTNSNALLSSLSGEPREICDANTIKEVIEEAENTLLRSRAFSAKTVHEWMRECSFLFEHLGELPGRAYPHFSRRYKKFGYIPADSTTLASLDFPETRGLSGAAKLRASLRLVSDAAMDVVKRHASFFEAAAPLRCGRIPLDLTTSARAACDAISVVVRAEILSHELTGHSCFIKKGARGASDAVDGAMKLLANPDVWREAGLSALLPEHDVLDFNEITNLVMCCIGASHQAALAAKVVFCCETGWNRQPIEDIPPEVYQFRVADAAGVASASFVSVFKRRAGHLVEALLEHSELSGGRATDVVAGWEDAERERSWGDFDQRCMLTYTNPAYTALELMRPLMESLDALTKDQNVHERFFKCISQKSGVSVSKRDIATVFKTGVLSTPGLHLKLIRKSYLQMMLREVGSVDSLRAHAGHAKTGVLLSHYLNSPDVRRELEQSTRFFQNAVQSLLVAEVGGSLELLMSPEQHEWFYNLARVSGVASSVGYGVSTPLPGPPSFTFTPSDEQVRALLTIGMSLDIEEKIADPRRWSLVGIPLRGFIKAILSKLRAAGMSRLVKRVDGELKADVRNKTVVLPPLNISGESE